METRPEGALSQVSLFWPLKCAALVPSGPMRTARALLLQLLVLQDEKLLSLLRCPGPAVRTPQQRAGRQGLPPIVAYCLLGRGAAEGPAHSTPRRGRGGKASPSLLLPPTYPSPPAPPELPIWPSPWSPPPLPYMVWGAPRLILSPALGSMNGLGAPQRCEGDQIRQGGRPGPPPLPPAAHN